MNILFVCRGNTCRSVLAQYIAVYLAKQHPILLEHVFRSAGVQVWPGQSASEHALEVLSKRYGIDAVSHQSSQLDEELIAWADKIYTMTPARKLQITDRFPVAIPKLELLSDRVPLEDPIGGDLEEYAALGDMIEDALMLRFNQLELL